MIMIKRLNQFYVTEFSRFFTVIDREPVFNTCDVTLTPSSEIKTDYTSNLIITNNDDTLNINKNDYDRVEIM